MKRFLVAAGVLALTLLLPAHPDRANAAPSAAQPPEIDREVAALIDRLSPEERVGQLFLIPLFASDVTEGTDISRLIDEFGVGGVVLSPERGNFVNAPDTPTQVARLTNALQARTAARDGSYVPMFIALESAGNGYPDTALWGGMTALPSQMALGAGWQPDSAERIGEIVGRELAAVGVNLLLGPSLDVLNVPRPGTSGDLSVRSFGGSPPWVALLGRRYIRGVHRGSSGHVATAAGNFPGIGGADRSQAEELPVVESSLQQLAALELPPFVSVADGASGIEAVTEAFMTSHVRYRGVQQQSDRPLSLDSGGLRYLWAQLPALSAWRDEGGLLVSAGLGLPAVRRYIDPNLVTFNSRRVIREALAAGNDVLTLTGFGPSDDPAAQLSEIESGMSWLAGEYGQDEAVREMVNGALVRVLTLKRRLYGRAMLVDVAVDEEAAAVLTGLGAEDVTLVARQALTLVTPTGAALGGQERRSPQAGDQILFVVDTRVVRECDGCETYLTLDPDRLLDQVYRAYGPEGTGRVSHATDVAAITFSELKARLQASGSVAAEDTPALVEPLAAERLAAVDALVDRADWIVFAMGDFRPAEAPGSDALKLFLKASPHEVAGQRLVAFAFGAPYYLDTTETAKLTAYYAVYASTDPFIAVAVRALFGDEPATGSSPVSIPGAGYDLAARLAPALDQPVTLELVGLDAQRPLGLGTTFRVRTSLIRDGNGHVVPDGTRVTFHGYVRDENVFLPDAFAETTDGRAMAVIRADRRGELGISAELNGGLHSAELLLRIEGDSVVGNLSLPDVGLPTILIRPRVPVDWGIYLLSLTLMLLAGVLFTGLDVEVARSPARLLRLFLLSLAWGLAGYLLVAAGGLQLASLPGGAHLWPAEWNVVYQAPLLSFVLALLPIVPSGLRALMQQWRAATAGPGVGDRSS